ncbi:MAG: transposase [Proteobacteria bacterium]|nr:transposase [Pseudomonadota bacterium]
MMARLGRCFLPGQPVHLIQRGNNRQPIFFAPEDYLQHLGWLADASAENGCAVFAYVLMTNHAHPLAAPEREVSVATSARKSAKSWRNV